MSIDVGQHVGHYEILSSIGVGGMGKVYRARDPKLKRDVAIKVLPEEFSTDADRLVRFQREAEVLASLNHPNIASIYGVEDANGTPCMVMELVDGETLAERVARGSLQVVEALSIARQIAEGLEAAHERGILHRDLKPANIKITPAGKVKVLDFGLAKPLDAAAASPRSDSPTLGVAGQTQANVILGTPAYMSPEQATGVGLDERSDIWAFGCVLYEMLSGRAVFGGNTSTEILAEILKSDPNWNVVPKNVPLTTRSLLKRCLQKDRRNRLRNITDARIEIEDALQESPSSDLTVTPASVPARNRERLLWMAIVAVLIAVSILASFAPFGKQVPTASEARLQIEAPQADDPISLAISPDGQRVVFSALTADRGTLWLRSLESLSARPLPGTGNGAHPFWSPDGRSIGFFADGKLKRIDLDSSSVQILADAPNGRGGTWNRSGVILFAPSAAAPIMRVSATGGISTPVTVLDRSQETNHRFPYFLTDGDHFLFFVQGTPEAQGTYIGSLADPTRKVARLMQSDSAAVFLPPRHLLFLRQSALFAQSFDQDLLEVTGDPVSLAGQVNFDGTASAGAFSAAANGSFIYRSGTVNRKLVWYDRSGAVVGAIGDIDPAQPTSPEFSPDGAHVSVQRTVNSNTDVWILDTLRGVPTRLTIDPGIEFSSIWSPDGASIIFTSNRKGVYDIYRKASSGTGPEELLLSSSWNKQVMDFSRDGSFILFRDQRAETAYNLLALPLSGNREPFPIVDGPFNEREGQFSPDTRWMAYASDESSQFEIYVRSFPKAGVKVRVSTAGGTQPRWRGDGKELFYMGLEGKLMAVPIAADSAGTKIEAGSPAALFQTRTVGGPLPQAQKHQYAVSSDGRRFLLNVVPEQAASLPITIVLNWSGSQKR